MAYVDGFLLTVPTRNLRAYRALAQKTARIWRDLGALECRECFGDDLDQRCGTPFPKRIQAKRGQTVVFSWIVYKSRAHRDAVNAKVMKDPRILKIMKTTKMPFADPDMSWGGFDVVVDA